MSWASFEKVRASKFPTPSRATASATLNLTSTITDVTGASVTVTLTRTMNYIAWGVFDGEAVIGSSTTLAIGYLAVDGSQQTEQAIFRALTNGERDTVSQVWSGTLAAGSHTLKLQGWSAGSSQFRFNQTHTTLTILWFG